MSWSISKVIMWIVLLTQLTRLFSLVDPKFEVSCCEQFELIELIEFVEGKKELFSLCVTSKGQSESGWLNNLTQKYATIDLRSR